MERALASTADASDEIKGFKVGYIDFINSSQKRLVRRDKRQLLSPFQASVNLDCSGKVQCVERTQGVVPDQPSSAKFQVRRVLNHEILLRIADDSLHNGVSGWLV